MQKPQCLLFVFTIIIIIIIIIIITIIIINNIRPYGPYMLLLHQYFIIFEMMYQTIISYTYFLYFLALGVEAFKFIDS